MTFETIAGTAAETAGFLMALSPLLQARKVVRFGDSAQVSPGAYLVTGGNGVIWWTYGLSSGNPVVIWPNALLILTVTATLVAIWRFRHGGPGGPEERGRPATDYTDTYVPQIGAAKRADTSEKLHARATRPAPRRSHAVD